MSQDATTAASITDKEIQAANNMFDEAIRQLKLKNDAALSRALEVAPPMISKIRHGHIRLGSSMIIRLHETTGWAIRTIKDALDEKCLKQLAVAPAA
jgi:plasmid maintenance system antidote protein VapI